MAELDKKMKDREEETKKEIERLRKENENAINLIKEKSRQELENLKAENQNKINEIREQGRLQIEQNNKKINDLLNAYGYDIDQLINNIN